MNRVQAQGQSIESLQKEVSFLKTELTGFYDLIQDLITKVPAMRAPAQAPSGDLASLRGEFESLKRHTSDQMKVMKAGFNVDGSKAERELGIKYTPIRVALEEAIGSFKK